MTDTITTLRYCTTCGTAMNDGRCPRCDGSGPLTTRRPVPRRRVTAVAAVVVLALGGSLYVASANAQAARTRSLRGRLDAATASSEALRHRAEADEASVAALGQRIDTLEATAQRTAGRDPAKIAAAVKKSVFTIETSGGLGSGFVIDVRSGTSYLLTNFHVIGDEYVNGNRDVKVRQQDRTYDGVVTQTSAADDLAVIAVNTALPVLSIATAKPAVGDTVMAFGSPLGLEGTVSAGIVSALRHEDGHDYLQFTAPISPGNSGGPVVDSDGRVVGIAEMKIVGNNADALAFAIPAGVACEDFTIC
jgi:putative serine protease PepD